MWIRFVAYLIGTVAFSSCSPPKPAELVGVYTFRSNEVQETLELKVGGKFTQKIDIGGRSFEEVGEWTIQKPRSIVFQDHFLVRYDFTEGEIINPPKRYSYYVGYWYGGVQRIKFDDDGKYVLNRQPGNNQSSH